MNSSRRHRAISAGSTFRYDINALRAWAVISVMMFHFRIPGFSGGFCGVDVFFVISGFLMTGIVLSFPESDKFALVKFYIARIRRIVPALLVLCAVLLIIGWLILAPDDYLRLAKQVRDGVFFISNNSFRKQSGYFDSASHDKWLLHTWSLSVEWQFYLLLPLIILGLTKIKKDSVWYTGSHFWRFYPFLPVLPKHWIIRVPPFIY
jgi:peptidoglycan/LPS O-acetylase OafA/YrhL